MTASVGDLRANLEAWCSETRARSEITEVGPAFSLRKWQFWLIPQRATKGERPNPRGLWVAKFGTFGKNMLRLLLKEGEAGKSLLEKLNLFQTEPGLLEKYIIASEVSVEVLDTFLARLFGNEKPVKAMDDGGLSNGLFECLGLSRKESGKSGSVNEELAGLRERVSQQDALLKEMQRQFSAIRRQLDMQQDVVRVAGAVDARLSEIAGECAERVSGAEKALRDEIQGVSEIVESIRTDATASSLEMQALREEVTRLKSDEKKVEDASKQSSVQITYNAERPLDGIISYLTRECGGNVHKTGAVDVTASSVIFDGYKPENAVDFTTEAWFCSKDEQKPWICYDFKQRRVAPTSYSIRSFTGKPGGAHPKSWALQVSDDGKVWDTIDSRENNSELNASSVTRNFPITTILQRNVRFVRLVQTGLNHFPNDRLVISGLELFGTMKLG